MLRRCSGSNDSIPLPGSNHTDFSTSDVTALGRGKGRAKGLMMSVWTKPVYFMGNYSSP